MAESKAGPSPGRMSPLNSRNRPMAALDTTGLVLISNRLVGMEDNLKVGRYDDALRDLDTAWIRLPTDARSKIQDKIPGKPSDIIRKRVGEMTPSNDDLDRGYGLGWASKDRKAHLRKSIAGDRIVAMCDEFEVLIIDCLTELGYYMREKGAFRDKQDFPDSVTD